MKQELRRYQSSAMDTSDYGSSKSTTSSSSQSSSQSASAAASTNTSVMTSSASSDSPVWSSGSGALKEFRLHDAEMKVGSSILSNIIKSFYIMTDYDYWNIIRSSFKHHVSLVLYNDDLLTSVLL